MHNGLADPCVEHFRLSNGDFSPYEFTQCGLKLGTTHGDQYAAPWITPGYNNYITDDYGRWTLRKNRWFGKVDAKLSTVA